MKIRLISFLIYQFIFLLWSSKIHDHFFEFKLMDQASLTVAAFIPLILLKVKPNIKIRFLWIVYVLFPPSLLLLVHLTIQFFSDSWILLHVFIISTGISILLSKNERPIFLGVASLTFVWFLPFSFHPNQLKYYDLLNATIPTRNGETDVVIWKNDQWIYYNNSLLISTIDGHIHSETLVHTSIPLFNKPKVLLIGDEYGFTRKEITKYNCSINHLPYDYELLSKSEIAIMDTTVINDDIFHYLKETSEHFNVIIIDLPDPEHLQFRHFYEDYFYQICFNKLAKNGILITNAGGYYTNEKFYKKIEGILNKQVLHVKILQAFIPTLGHRVWILAGNNIHLNQLEINVPTKWINLEAIQLMLSGGKKSYPF